MLFNRIVQFREYNKIPIETIAKALNISQEEYLKYESGTITPDIATITSLAKIYKVTVNEFYGHTPRLTLHDDPNTTQTELNSDKEFKFAELSIDEKELILKYRLSENKEEIFDFISKK